MQLTKTTILASTLLSLFVTAQTAGAVGQAPDDEYNPFSAAIDDHNAEKDKVLYALQNEDSIEVAKDYFDKSAQK